MSIKINQINSHKQPPKKMIPNNHDQKQPQQNQKKNNTQPTIVESQQQQPPKTIFKISVKLLSNEVYEFIIDPDMLVLEFKNLVKDKVHVPVQRQRLVYGGKQLLDHHPIKQYVKESGKILHLIAKSVQAPENPHQPSTSTTTSTATSTPPQANQNQTQLQPNPFGGIMNMMNGMLGNISVTTVNNGSQNIDMNHITNNLNSILDGLGIRLPPINLAGSMPQPSPASRQTIPTNSTNNTNQQTTTTSQPPTLIEPTNTNSYRVSSNPIIQLSNSINSLVLPPEPVNLNNEQEHLTLRQQTSQYLRRLQHQMLRVIPQLNRGIQLLNQGRTTHLSGFVPIFQALSLSNSVAIQAINRLQLSSGSNTQLPAFTSSNNQPVSSNNPVINNTYQQQQQTLEQNTNYNNSNNPISVSATIIIQGAMDDGENDMDMDMDVQQQQGDIGNNSQQQQAMTGQNSTGGMRQQQIPAQLAGLLGMFGGNNRANQQGQHINLSNFNLAGLFGNINIPQPPPPTATAQNNATTQSQSPTLTQQPTVAQQPTVTQQQPNNSLAGLNIMGMLGELNQNGGMNSIMTMSLGEMLQQQTHTPNVYSSLLKPINGSQILSCFLQKNFDFLNIKRLELRAGVIQAISIVESRQNLQIKLTDDTVKLIVPRQNLKNAGSCQKKVRSIVRKHFESMISLLLSTQNTGGQLFSERLIQILKKLLCESITQISKFSQNQETVFLNIKKNVTAQMDRYLQGLSGMFYMILERDLVRIYQAHKEDMERKASMSKEQADNQEELMRMIQEEGKKDKEYLEGFGHSRFYFPRGEGEGRKE